MTVSPDNHTEKSERFMQNQPVLLGIKAGGKRLTLPLGSPDCPRQLTRGRVIGAGISGCTGIVWGLARMGVRMGMADMAGMADRPTDRFGIEPIPIWRRHTGEHEEIRNTVWRQTGAVTFKNGQLSFSYFRDEHIEEDVNEIRLDWNILGGIFTKACCWRNGWSRIGDGRLLHDEWQGWG